MSSKYGAIAVAGMLVSAAAALAFAQHALVEQEQVERALKAGLVLSLAEELELDEQETGALLREYREHAEELDRLRAQQAALREELMRATGPAVQTHLERLMAVDQELREAQAAAAQAIGADMEPAHRARVYLLLSTLDEHVRIFLAPTREMGEAHREMLNRAREAAAPPPLPAEPEEAILHTLGIWAEGLEGQNLERVMRVYSADFAHEEYGDRTGMREFLQQAQDMGYLTGIEVVLENAEISTLNGTATVQPVEMHGNFGQVTASFTLQRENGHWRIIGLELSGV